MGYSSCLVPMILPLMQASFTSMFSLLFHQYAAREAEIIAQAGRKFAITISTNMAGRGTDIILGGNPKVSVLVG